MAPKKQTGKRQDNDDADEVGKIVRALKKDSALASENDRTHPDNLGDDPEQRNSNIAWRGAAIG